MTEQEQKIITEKTAAFFRTLVDGHPAVGGIIVGIDEGEELFLVLNGSADMLASMGAATIDGTQDKDFSRTRFVAQLHAILIASYGSLFKVQRKVDGQWHDLADTDTLDAMLVAMRP